MARRRRTSARVKWWKRKSQSVSVATWNVRSLVEIEGPLSTASSSGHVVEDGNIVRVVECLRRYDVDVAGLQETHWFCEAIYRIGGRLVLTSGRPLPAAGESCRRCEGVACLWFAC